MSILTATVAAFSRALPATRANRLLILIYHRVHPRPDPMFPGEVDAERFSWQMDLLQRHCNPLPLVDAIAAMRAGRLPPRAVTVTFDDGYADNVSVALPILLERRIHATFFIATGFLDGGRMWNDTVIESVRLAPGPALDLSDFGLGSLPIGDPVSRGQAADRILKAIKHLPPDDRLGRARSLATRIERPLPSNLMMTSDQVRSLAGTGMEVGAHTVNHPILRVLSDASAGAEIADSRRVLEAMIGQPVRAFAYPNGRPGDDYTERDRKLVESQQFELAVSTRAGVATTASDRFQLPRFTPWDRQPERWLARLLLTFGRRS